MSNPYAAPQPAAAPDAESSATPGLTRGLGLWQATSLNVANMVGIGPFITIPLFMATMGGPHALIAWIIAAVLVICDGLVWSELGAALPGSGGTYHFLREIYGRHRWGRILPFVFIWQFLISGALEMASGYIGGLQYLEYAVPQLKTILPEHLGGAKWLAAGAAIVVTLVLCQNIGRLGWLSVVLCAGTIITVLTVIVAGLVNFNAELLTLPTGGIRLDRTFASGLGAAMLIAIYDYLGYYNICHLGDEVRDPGRTIPLAVMISVVLVAAIYLTMNIAIIGVIPWQEAMQSENIASLFMERLYGRPVAVAFTGLILWTSLACLFAITLGYSRIPYAAAKSGDFFPVFAFLHPTGRFPIVSLLVLGGLTAVFCFFKLQTVIDAAVTVRILVQFVAQIGALHLVRTTRPDIVLPFRMWLYPLPSLLALAGWLFVLSTAQRLILLASLAVIVSGCVAYVLWTALRGWSPPPARE
jgi:amino acid transporter